MFQEVVLPNLGAVFEKSTVGVVALVDRVLSGLKVENNFSETARLDFLK